MLGKLGTLIGLRARTEEGAVCEAFGDVRASRSVGLEILRGTPGRRNCVQGIRDALASMTREQKDELIDRVLARLALFVFDLPASERNHHSRRFGLLDHLLEVAFHAARELSGPAFQVSPEPSVQHREGPLWAYGGVIAAIAHDIGKPLDLDVAAPGSPERWDPTREPLKCFCDRLGLSGTGPELWHFRPGRGMRSHESAIGQILPVVLPPQVEEFLGPRLGSILRAMSTEDWAETPGILRAARDVIRVIRRIDQATSIEDHEGRAEPGARPPSAEVQSSEAAPDHEAHETCRPLPATASNVRPPAAESAPEDTEDLPYVPLDLWEEPVPKPKADKGDPVETARKLEAALEPSRFLELVRRMIVRCRLPRNGLYSEVYVRPDYVWLILPAALRRIARINHLPFNTVVLDRMVSALGVTPQVESFNRKTVPLYIRTRPDSGAFRAVRIKREGFLSDEEISELGVHEFEIAQALPIAVQEAAE